MTLTLHLPEKLEQKLRAVAQQHDLSEAAWVEQLLTEKLEPTIRTLESRLTNPSQDDILEQQETWRVLQQGLMQNKDNDRELFPPEQQGKSW